MTSGIFKVNVVCIDPFSAANKYSSASHHEQKAQRATGQIRFLAVTIKQ